MADTAFVFLLGFYLWFGSKVSEWIAISNLGFTLAVPQGFLDKPSAYSLISTAILAMAVACLYFADHIPWYVGLIMATVTWFATTTIGRRRAFETYRRHCREAVAEAEDEKEREFFAREASKSNGEIGNLLIQKMKLRF